jgi:hypothetical protein
MESPENRKLKQQLEKMQAEIDKDLQRKVYPVSKVPQNPPQTPGLANLSSQISSWYRSLPTNTKAIVLVGGGVVGLVVVGAFLRLVSALFTLAVLAGGAYLVYKLWIEPKENG